MIFKEPDCIPFPRYLNCFVYFLLKNNEVVYVGQTCNGYARILQHYNSAKDFDEVFIKPCDEYELDGVEDYYIKKYVPRYNKKLNGASDYTLQSALNYINTMYAPRDKTKPRLTELGEKDYEIVKKYTMRQLKDMMHSCEIRPFVFNTTLYITADDMSLIEDGILNFLMGVEGYEVFGIRV